MQNELYHFGIKGMRWGHRKGSVETTNYRKTSNKLKKSLAADDKAERLGYKEFEYKRAHNKVNKTYLKDARQAGEEANRAFRDYIKERNKPNEKYMTETTKIQKMTDKHLFSYGTVKKINRTLNENKNMSVSDARSKIHKEALRNSNNCSRIKNSDAATIFD